MAKLPSTTATSTTTTTIVKLPLYLSNNPTPTTKKLPNISSLRHTTSSSMKWQPGSKNTSIVFQRWDKEQNRTKGGEHEFQAMFFSIGVH